MNAYVHLSHVSSFLKHCISNDKDITYSESHISIRLSLHVLFIIWEDLSYF